MKTIGIYGIKNRASGKWYIGQSIQIEIRLRHHLTSLRRSDHPNAYLLRAYKKYGEEQFEFVLLESTTRELLGEREKYWITFYQSLSDDNGYNLETGGNLNKEVSLARRIRSSLSQRGRPHKHCGRRHSEETRKRISLSKLGRPRSPELREKLSKYWTGKKRPHKGGKWSDERKESWRARCKAENMIQRIAKKAA